MNAPPPYRTAVRACMALAVVLVLGVNGYLLGRGDPFGVVAAATLANLLMTAAVLLLDARR